jgi:hypothetical protein
MPDIKRGETKLYNLIASYYKQSRMQEGSAEDEETEDVEMENEQENHHTEFKIAIVGGKKVDEDKHMA